MQSNSKMRWTAGRSKSPTSRTVERLHAHLLIRNFTRLNRSKVGTGTESQTRHDGLGRGRPWGWEGLKGFKPVKADIETKSNKAVEREFHNRWGEKKSNKMDYMFGFTDDSKYTTHSLIKSCTESGFWCRSTTSEHRQSVFRKSSTESKSSPIRSIINIINSITKLYGK